MDRDAEIDTLVNITKNVTNKYFSKSKDLSENDNNLFKQIENLTHARHNHLNKLINDSLCLKGWNSFDLENNNTPMAQVWGIGNFNNILDLPHGRPDLVAKRNNDTEVFVFDISVVSSSQHIIESAKRKREKYVELIDWLNANDMNGREYVFFPLIFLDKGVPGLTQTTLLTVGLDERINLTDLLTRYKAKIEQLYQMADDRKALETEYRLSKMKMDKTLEMSLEGVPLEQLKSIVSEQCLKFFGNKDTVENLISWNKANKGKTEHFLNSFKSSNLFLDILDNKRYDYKSVEDQLIDSENHFGSFISNDTIDYKVSLPLYVPVSDFQCDQFGYVNDMEYHRVIFQSIKENGDDWDKYVKIIKQLTGQLDNENVLNLAMFLGCPLSAEDTRKFKLDQKKESIKIPKPLSILLNRDDMSTLKTDFKMNKPEKKQLSELGLNTVKSSNKKILPINEHTIGSAVKFMNYLKKENTKTSKFEKYLNQVLEEVDWLMANIEKTSVEYETYKEVRMLLLSSIQFLSKSLVTKISYYYQILAKEIACQDQSVSGNCKIILISSNTGLIFLPGATVSMEKDSKPFFQYSFVDKNEEEPDRLLYGKSKRFEIDDQKDLIIFQARNISAAKMSNYTNMIIPSLAFSKELESSCYMPCVNEKNEEYNVPESKIVQLSNEVFLSSFAIQMFSSGDITDFLANSRYILADLLAGNANILDFVIDKFEGPKTILECLYYSRLSVRLKSTFDDLKSSTPSGRVNSNIGYFDVTHPFLNCNIGNSTTLNNLMYLNFFGVKKSRKMATSQFETLVLLNKHKKMYKERNASKDFDLNNLKPLDDKLIPYFELFNDKDDYMNVNPYMIMLSAWSLYDNLKDSIPQAVLSFTRDIAKKRISRKATTKKSLNNYRALQKTTRYESTLDYLTQTGDADQTDLEFIKKNYFFYLGDPVTVSVMQKPEFVKADREAYVGDFKSMTFFMIAEDFFGKLSEKCPEEYISKGGDEKLLKITSLVDKTYKEADEANNEVFFINADKTKWNLYWRVEKSLLFIIPLIDYIPLDLFYYLVACSLKLMDKNVFINLPLSKSYDESLIQEKIKVNKEERLKYLRLNDPISNVHPDIRKDKESKVRISKEDEDKVRSKEPISRKIEKELARDNFGIHSFHSRWWDAFNLNVIDHVEIVTETKNNFSKKHLNHNLLDMEFGFLAGFINLQSSLQHVSSFKLLQRIVTGTSLCQSITGGRHSDDSITIIQSTDERSAFQVNRMRMFIEHSCQFFDSTKKTSISQNYMEFLSIYKVKNRYLSPVVKDISNLVDGLAFEGYPQDIISSLSFTSQMTNRGCPSSMATFYSLLFQYNIRWFYGFESSKSRDQQGTVLDYKNIFNKPTKNYEDINQIMSLASRVGPGEIVNKCIEKLYGTSDVKLCLLPPQLGGIVIAPASMIAVVGMQCIYTLILNRTSNPDVSFYRQILWSLESDKSFTFSGAEGIEDIKIEFYSPSAFFFPIINSKFKNTLRSLRFEYKDFKTEQVMKALSNPLNSVSMPSDPKESLKVLKGRLFTNAFKDSFSLDQDTKIKRALRSQQQSSVVMYNSEFYKELVYTYLEFSKDNFLASILSRHSPDELTADYVELSETKLSSSTGGDYKRSVPYKVFIFHCLSKSKNLNVNIQDITNRCRLLNNASYRSFRAFTSATINESLEFNVSTSTVARLDIRDEMLSLVYKGSRAIQNLFNIPIDDDKLFKVDKDLWTQDRIKLVEVFGEIEDDQVDLANKKTTRGYDILSVFKILKDSEKRSRITVFRAYHLLPNPKRILSLIRFNTSYRQIVNVPKYNQLMLYESDFEGASYTRTASIDKLMSYVCSKLLILDSITEGISLTQLIESVTVDFYGTKVKISEVIQELINEKRYSHLSREELLCLATVDNVVYNRNVLLRHFSSSYLSCLVYVLESQNLERGSYVGLASEWYKKGNVYGHVKLRVNRQGKLTELSLKVSKNAVGYDVTHFLDTIRRRFNITFVERDDGNIDVRYMDLKNGESFLHPTNKINSYKMKDGSCSWVNDKSGNLWFIEDTRDVPGFQFTKVIVGDISFDSSYNMLSDYVVDGQVYKKIIERFLIIDQKPSSSLISCQPDYLLETGLSLSTYLNKNIGSRKEKFSISDGDLVSNNNDIISSNPYYSIYLLHSTDFGTMTSNVRLDEDGRVDSDITFLKETDLPGRRLKKNRSNLKSQTLITCLKSLLGEIDDTTKLYLYDYVENLQDTANLMSRRRGGRDMTEQIHLVSNLSDIFKFLIVMDSNKTLDTEDEEMTRVSNLVLDHDLKKLKKIQDIILSIPILRDNVNLIGNNNHRHDPIL